MKLIKKHHSLGVILLLFLFSLVLATRSSMAGTSNFNKIPSMEVFSFLGVGCDTVLAAKSKADKGGKKERGETLPGYTEKPTRDDSKAPTPHYYDDLPNSRGDQDREGPLFYGRGREMGHEIKVGSSTWRDSSHPMYRRDRSEEHEPVQVPLHIYDIPPTAYQNPTALEDDEGSIEKRVHIIDMNGDDE